MAFVFLHFASFSACAWRKTDGDIEGTILVNGHPKEQQSFNRISGFVEQFNSQIDILGKGVPRASNPATPKPLSTLTHYDKCVHTPDFHSYILGVTLTI
jgi:hypothetical protein